MVNITIVIIVIIILCALCSNNNDEHMANEVARAANQTTTALNQSQLRSSYGGNTQFASTSLYCSCENRTTPTLCAQCRACAFVDGKCVQQLWN